MLADFIKQAITAGGTSNLTLGSAITNFYTIDSGIALNVRFPYVIRDGAAWETGMAYLSATLTLVRETFFRSSTGSALNVTTSAVIGIANSAYNHFELSQIAPGGTISSPHYIRDNVTATAYDANELWYEPFRLMSSDTYDAFEFEVKAGSGNLRIGLHDIKQGMPHNLIAVHNTSFNISTTGAKVVTFDAGSTELTAGDYAIVTTLDGSIDFAGYPITGRIANIFGSNYGNGATICAQKTKSKTYTSLPTLADVSSLIDQFSGAVSFGLRQG